MEKFDLYWAAVEAVAAELLSKKRPNHDEFVQVANHWVRPAHDRSYADERDRILDWKSY